MKKLAIAAAAAAFVCVAHAEDAVPAKHAIKLTCESDYYYLSGVITRDSGSLALSEYTSVTGGMQDMGKYSCSKTGSVVLDNGETLLVFRSEKRKSTEFILRLPESLFDGAMSAEAPIAVRKGAWTSSVSMDCRAEAAAE